MDLNRYSSNHDLSNQCMTPASAVCDFGHAWKTETGTICVQVRIAWKMDTGTNYVQVGMHFGCVHFHMYCQKEPKIPNLSPMADDTITQSSRPIRDIVSLRICGCTMEVKKGESTLHAILQFHMKENYCTSRLFSFLGFFTWTYKSHAFKLSCGKCTAKEICAVHTKTSGDMITRPSSMTVKIVPAATALQNSQKETRFPLFTSWCLQINYCLNHTLLHS